MRLLPIFLAGRQRRANLFRGAELPSFCFVPAFVDLSPRIGFPSLLILQQPQCFAHNVISRLKFATRHFSADKIFERRGQAHIHSTSFIEAAV